MTTDWPAARRELRYVYEERVTLVMPAEGIPRPPQVGRPDRPGTGIGRGLLGRNPMTRARAATADRAAVPDLRIIEAAEPDDAVLAGAGVADAAALALVYEDDETNLRAALLARRLNPRLRLVIRLYNRKLGQHLESLLDQAAIVAEPGLDLRDLDSVTTVLSDADTAAPALAASAVAGTSKVIQAEGLLLRAVERTPAEPGRVADPGLCTLALLSATANDPAGSEGSRQVRTAGRNSCPTTGRWPPPQAVGSSPWKRSPRWRRLPRWTAAEHGPAAGGLAVLTPAALGPVRAHRRGRRPRRGVLAHHRRPPAARRLPDPPRHLRHQRPRDRRLHPAQGAPAAGRTARPAPAAGPGRGRVRSARGLPHGHRAAAPAPRPVRPRGAARPRQDRHPGAGPAQRTRHPRRVRGKRPGGRGLALARNLRVPVVMGDVTEEGVLEAARVHRAHSLLALTSSDTTNLEAALYARAGKSDIRAVLRLYDDDFATAVYRTLRAAHPAALTRSRSVTFMAAPAFAGAMLGRQILGAIPVERRVLLFVGFEVAGHPMLEGRTVRECFHPGAWRVVALDPSAPGERRADLGRGEGAARSAAELRWVLRPDDVLKPDDRVVIAATRRGLAELLGRRHAAVGGADTGPADPARDHGDGRP